MKRSALMITSVVAAAVLSSGCDRKSESTTAENDTISAAPQAVSATTVTAVGMVPADAGPDASPTVVGVAVTTIATRGNPHVVDALARARCDRELRCGNIANGKQYLTTDQCLTSVATEWREDLNRYECPGGFDQKDLDECMREIKNEDCRNPFDRLERIIACRASDICID